MGGKSGGGYRAPVEAPNTIQSQQEVTIIDAVSEGPIVGLATGNSKSIALDFTPLQTEAGTYTFQDVSWDIRLGTADQTAYPNIDGSETEVGLSLEVTKDFPKASGTGSGAVARQVTNENVTKIRITLGVRGLYETLKDDKNRAGDMIGCTIQYNVKINDGGGTLFINQNFTKTAKTTAGAQWKHLFNVGHRPGPWTVTVTRLTADNTNANKVDALYFDSMTEIIGYKLIYPHTASILIKGTAETFGNSVPTRVYRLKGIICEVPSNYNPETRTYTGIWNGVFKNAWTDNPAWILRDIVEHDRYGLKKRFPPAVQGNPLIDKWTLYDISKLCDATVSDGKGGSEPRYTFNGQIMGSGEAKTVIQSIASVFHGMTYWGSGSLYTITDYPSDPIRTINQTNVMDGLFTYSTGSAQEKHSVAVVTWYDPDDYGRSCTEIVYDWEALQQIGYREIKVTAYGCYSRGQAYRQGLWTLLSEQEQWQVSFSMGLDGYDLMVGDRIKIADPTWMGARLSGRVKSINVLKTQVTLDAPVELLPTEEYTLNLVAKTGAEESKKITAISEDKKTVTLQSALTNEFVDLCVWSISGTDVSPRVFAIRSIKEEELGVITISAYRVLQDKYTQLESGLVLPETPGRRPPVLTIPMPTGLMVTASTYFKNNVPEQRLTFSWDSSGNPDVAYYQASYKSPVGDWNDYEAKKYFTVDVPVAYSGVWEFRVRALSIDGRTSEWATTSYTVTGISTIPSEPSNLKVTGGFRSLTVKWDMVNDPLVGMYEIALSETDKIADAEIVGRILAGSMEIKGLAILKVYWVWVRSVSVADSGIYSDWVGPVSGTTFAIEMDDFITPVVTESDLVDSMHDLAEKNIDSVVGLYDGQKGHAKAIAEARSEISEVDGNVRAQYTIQTQAIGAKNAVAGIGLFADGQTGSSEFIVLADKFFIYNPKDGAIKKVFQLVDQQAYIDGDIIATGTIQGDKINAQTRIQLAEGGELVIGAGGVIQIGTSIILDGGTGSFF